MKGLSNQQLNDIANKAGLKGEKTEEGTFYTEFKKGINLAQYVEVKEDY